MKPRKPINKPQPPRGKKPQHWYNHHHYWPHYHDWYWDDYDYYYWDDYDWDTLAPNRARAPGATDTLDEYLPYYQQGFKDGWAAAMDYMTMYGTVEQVEPMPPPKPMPMPPPMPSPTEGDNT